MTATQHDTRQPSGDIRNRARIEKYTQFWKPESKQDTEKDNQHRIKEYESVTNSYYDGATDLYEYGWGKVR
jgi:sterol 24-C-methyltransferase